jgi:hypothetical protein
MNVKWHDIIQRWLAGTAAEAEAAELQEALKTDGELRTLYLEYANLDAALEIAANVASMGRASLAEFPERTKERKSTSTRPWWIPAAAAAAIAAIASWFLFVTPDSAKQANLAVLTREAGAVWAEAGPPVGRPLPSRWLKLRAGAAELVLSRGARVLLEGPAEFRIESENAGFLKAGKLHAYVPTSAHGFVVRGERFQVTDKGTEFACAVPQNGATEVHVFTGTVSIGNARGAARDLSAAEAARVDEAGIQAIPARPGAFIRDGDFARPSAAGAAQAMEKRWQNRTALSGHPAALVHFDFEEGLPFQNLARADYVPNAMACQIAEGREPGTHALAFQSPESRVRMTVPGEFQSLTLLAWVRWDGQRHSQHSLLMGDSEQPGEIHWYLTPTGEVCFALIGPDQKWRRLESTKAIRVQNPGSWHFLAATFDGTTAVLYLDGQPVGSSVFEDAGPLKLRTFEIGNWGGHPGMPLRASAQHATSPSFYLRAFEGRIDEFAILSTALAAEEIRRLYGN